MCERSEFTGRPLPDVKQFRDNLRDLPVIDRDDLTHYAHPNLTPEVIERVKLRNVVALIAEDTWDLADRDHCYNARGSYVYEIARSLSTGKFDISDIAISDPIVLFDYQGLYGILDDGRHRIAAAKGLDNNASIIAKVHKFTNVEEVVIRGELRSFIKGLLEMEKRRRAGLWQGSWVAFKKGVGISGDFVANARVSDYQGPWVFALNMEKTKQMYDYLRESK